MAGGASTTAAADCFFSLSLNASFQSRECLVDVRRLLRLANNQLWTEHRNSKEYLYGADIYTTVILVLFASIIILLMVRAIKPNETLDDQVTMLLNSMRVRVEYENNVRQKKKLREAKKTAQKWLNDIKFKNLRKMSFRRARSTDEVQRVDDFSVKSTPAAPLRVRGPACRTVSYQGYLPEIVVTPHDPTPNTTSQDESTPSRPQSRQSSVFSFDLASPDSVDRDDGVFDPVQSV